MDIFWSLTLIVYPFKFNTVHSTTVAEGSQSIFDKFLFITIEFLHVVPDRWTYAAPGMRLTGIWAVGELIVYPDTGSIMGFGKVIIASYDLNKHII